MAFSFDSFQFAVALALFAAAVTAWRMAGVLRSGARSMLRFALVLFAALGVAGMAAAFFARFAPMLPVVALLVASLGSAALCLCLFSVFSRPVMPWAATLALTAALAAGLAAALLARPAVALAVQLLACAPVILIGFARLGDAVRQGAQVLAGGFALLCSGMALMDGAAPLSMLFLAAALLALSRASQLGVEQQRGRRSLHLIG